MLLDVSLTLSNTPLTKLPDSSVPNLLDISIASLMHTASGMSSR